jgi:ASC-1-like (ASCH) protein
MDKKTFRLRFREVNRDIFEAIQGNRKTIETRAATVRYREIKKGDRVILVCGKDVFEKSVADAQIFKSIDDLFKKYKVKQINPNVETEEEMRKLYYSFSGYREKIKTHGIIAIELK